MEDFNGFHPLCNAIPFWGRKYIITNQKQIKSCDIYIILWTTDIYDAYFITTINEESRNKTSKWIKAINNNRL